ncbi:ribosome biogenesis GTPase Der [Chitinimonas sp. BJB300]|uniref:ribosome biogenesis GTPase Der n=1 Tax=Chitinimonas sp. BJB300 TaxID=1559339 RepID=UPI000C0EC9E7|nr:ribosome biogenesis GTPase Der [Chitinimonas sp. BJB300]PHV12994.1 ribosome biogenesis GTPase Der [Chitinimonas sp. BJB300]TSJ88949.1 ribosome biogenesis GTPase Der [Chitinimonas sp. BJB300]
MKPTIALVGRPNVGKSTLFNRLTKSRDALVADQPGLTRDRHYGHGKVGSKPYLVVDTGGFEPVADDGILHEMARQTLQAIDEADAVVFIVDGRVGLTPQDKLIANRLRQLDRPVRLAVNKAEGMPSNVVIAEFFELALGEPWPISGAHGEGVRSLVEDLLDGFEVEVEEEELDYPKFAIIGRPNVGKSTLVNAILGEERVIAFDQPGTTRDSIYIDFERNARKYTVIDTAGVRKRAKVDEVIEKFSVVKTMQAIEDANVVVLVLDARQDVAEQDAHIAGFALEAGRAMVVAVNKWEGLDLYSRDQVKRDIARKLGFLDFARFHYISALEGQGVGDLFASIDAAYKAAMAKLPTPRLTRAMQLAMEKQQPPRAGLIRPKLKYAHQGGTNPPVVVVHGTALEHIPTSYWRYLEHSFLKMFKLQGTPLRVQFKKSENPYDTKPGEFKPDRKGVMRGEHKPGMEVVKRVRKKTG